MKNFKRIMAALLAVLMISMLAMSVMAETTLPEDLGDDGSITIKNAEDGDTYEIYSIFDAYRDPTDATKVAYYVTNTALYNLIIAEADDVYDTVGDCPFKIVGEQDPDKGWPVVHKDSAHPEYGRGWLLNHLETPEVEEGEEDPAFIGWGATARTHETETCDDNTTVTFEDLPYGYYLIVPPQNDAASATDDPVVSVNTAAPKVEVIVKNSRVPSDPGKEASVLTAEIGEDVAYTIDFTAVNFKVSSSNNGGTSESHMIYQYVIKDTMKGGDFKQIDSIKVYSKDDDGEFTVEEATITPYNATTNPKGYTLVANSGTGNDTTTITIPWAQQAVAAVADDPATTDVDETAAAIPAHSYYASPVKVVISYTATVDEEALDAITNVKGANVIKNTAEYDWYATENVTGDLPDQVEYVYTTGISVRKTDGSTPAVLLEGAKFKLYKVVHHDAVGETAAYDETLWYQWDSTNQKVVWVASKDNATEVEADNNYATMEFKGLKAGTYYLRETVVPAGFVPLASDPVVVLNVTENATPGGFTVSTSTVDGSTVENNNNPYITASIVNTSNNPMPSTGGAGTVLLIAGGAFLFAATAVVLVTKKRMYNED